MKARAPKLTLWWQVFEDNLVRPAQEKVILDRHERFQRFFAFLAGLRAGVGLTRCHDRHFEVCDPYISVEYTSAHKIMPD